MKTSSNRWLVAIVVVVVALVVLSVVIALVSPVGGVKDLPADAPEGVVQRYIMAVQERDYPLAHSYFSARLQRACTVDNMITESRWVAEGAGRRRVELGEKKSLSDGRTQVKVRITDVDVSPPFGVNEFSHDEWYVLVREGGAWRVDSLGWPVTWCPGLTEPASRPLLRLD